MIPMLIGAGLGAGLGLLQNREQKKAQRRTQMAEAAKTQYSPWSGLGAGQTVAQAPSAFGSMLQGGMAGAMIGQKIPWKKSAAQNVDVPNTETNYQKNVPVLSPWAGI